MPTDFVRSTWCALSVIVACGTSAWAARNEPEPFSLRDANVSEAAESPPAVADPLIDPFDKGSWSIYAHGTYYLDLEDNGITVGFGTVGVGYYYRNDWSWNFQLAGYDLQQDEQPDKYGGSFDVVLRGHFINRDPWTIFIDGGAGIFYSDRAFPAGGTHINFTLQAGFGATYRLNEDTHLMGGAKWFHISNARRNGRDRNPHTDGIAFYLGVMWTR